MLTEAHKSKRIVAALKFLERYHKGRDTFFLDQMLVDAGDETSFSHIIAESKRQLFSFIVKSHKIQTDVVNPESLVHSFFGGRGRQERRAYGGIYAQRPDRQRCVISCKSEAATTRHPKPSARPAVSGAGSAAR
jgi:hypothetical protein